MALDINGYNSAFRSFVIADKVENLCGAVHREQASSVMTMLSQAGLGDLRGGLLGYGIAAFAIFPLATLSPAEFPDAFDKFAAFATALADRLDAERAGMAVTPDGEPPADGETPAFDPGLISV